MAIKSRKTLHYLRAIIDSKLIDLEKILREILIHAPTAHDTQINEFGLLTQIQYRNLKLQNSGSTATGLILHIGKGAQDEHMRTMNNKSISENDSGGVQAPPLGQSFLSKEAFVYINKHHVLFCGNGLLAPSVASYFSALSKMMHQKNTSIPIISVEFHAVANCDKLKMIQEQGVRYISMNASAYELSIKHIDNDTDSKNVKSSLMSYLRKVVSHEPDLQSLTAQEDIQAGIFLRLNGNSKASIEAQQIMKIQAEKALDEDSIFDSFYIETQTGEKILPHDVRVSKTALIPKFEQTNVLNQTEVFHNLQLYYSELLSKNLVES